MTCEGRRDHILLYLTDGLDSADRESLEEHLQDGCPQCLAELSAAREVIGWLPLALTSKQPGRSVKQALMERVRHDVEVSQGDSAPLTGRPSRSAGASPPAEPTPPHAVRSPRVDRRRRYLTQILSPLVVALIAIVATYGIMTQELRQSRNQFSTLADEVASLRGSLQQSDEQLEELRSFQDVTRDFWSVVNSRNSKYVQLESTGGQQPCLARLFLDIQKRLGFYFPGEQCPLEADQRYELLLFPDENGEPIHAAEFELQEHRPMRLTLHLPNEPRRYSRISIRELIDRNGAPDEQEDDGVLFGTIGDSAW